MLGYLIIHRTIFFLFVTKFSILLLCKIYVFGIFEMVDFFFRSLDFTSYRNSDRIKLSAGSVYEAFQPNVVGCPKKLLYTKFEILRKIFCDQYHPK